MTRIAFLIATALTLLACSDGTSPANPAAASGPTVPTKAEPERPVAGDAGIPVRVAPCYDSTGPLIDVGPYSEELAEADADSIGELTARMKEQWPTLSIELMNVISIRHYDLGLKDDAVYWFYCAQYRASLFRSLLSPDSLRQPGTGASERVEAHKTFQQSAGEYINGYAFGVLP